MADDNSTQWKLDLDISDAASKLDEFKGGIDNLGSSEGLTSLISSLGEAGIVVGTIGAAFFALKETMDLVFEGENIEAVNQQFEILTSNAGLAGEALKSGLLEASAGLVDETTLLKGANEALTKMNVGAEKLPEIMTLAREASAATGKDLMETFNGISQAVASGNTRQLRQFGLTIDQTKAYKDYAASIGVSVDQLSQQGKSQAILNATLEQGSAKFAGMNVDIKEATNAWATFKAAMVGVGEVFALVFERTIGPTLAHIFTDLAHGAAEAKTALMSVFGNPTEKAAADLQKLQDKVTDLKAQLASAEKMKGSWLGGLAPGAANKAIAELPAKIAAAQAALDAAHAKDKAASTNIIADSAKVAQAKMVDDAKVAADHAKIAKEMAALDAELVKKELLEMTTVKEADKIYEAQKLAEVKKVDAQIEAFHAAHTQQEIAKNKQLGEMLVKLNKLRIKTMETDETAKEKLEFQALDQYQAKSTNVFQAIARQAEVNGKKSAKSMTDSAAIGSSAMTAFSNNAVSGFQAIGNGSKSVGDAMSSMFGGMIGDMATNYGKFLLAKGIGDSIALMPIGPGEIAAGGALLALGGLLGSIGGGGGSAPSAASGAPSPSAASTGTANVTPGPDTSGTANAGPSAAVADANPQKNVNFIVSGNLYSSNEAKMEMMDIMRSATDATGYKYTQVGSTA